MSKVIYKERKNTHSRKWDGCIERFGKEDLLPLWIADMDFEIPECVKDALKEYIDFGVFGYYDPPNEFYDAFIKWEEKYQDYKIDKEWLRYGPGIVASFNWMIHILTNAGDSIIIQPPVYYPFFEAIENNDRKIIENPLVFNGESYVMDYEDFEQKVIEHNVKLFMLCSPHNPVGRVWKKEELQKILDICKKHKIYVIADEVHQDLVMKGYKKITAATVGDYEDILITLTAASKTFNLASCQNSFLIIPNEGLRAKYDDYLERLRIRGGNAFGYIAVQSAYENGREWLEEVLEIVESNYNLMKNMLKEHLPKAWVSDLEGTYLMWINLGAYVAPGKMVSVIQEQCGLAVDYGEWFRGEAYQDFIRINLTTSVENIRLAAEKIIKVLKDK